MYVKKKIYNISCFSLSHPLYLNNIVLIGYQKRRKSINNKNQSFLLDYYKKKRQKPFHEMILRTVGSTQTRRFYGVIINPEVKVLTTRRRVSSNTKNGASFWEVHQDTALEMTVVKNRENANILKSNNPIRICLVEEHGNQQQELGLIERLKRMENWGDYLQTANVEVYLKRIDHKNHQQQPSLLLPNESVSKLLSSCDVLIKFVSNPTLDGELAQLVTGICTNRHLEMGSLFRSSVKLNESTGKPNKINLILDPLFFLGQMQTWEDIVSENGGTSMQLIVNESKINNKDCFFQSILEMFSYLTLQSLGGKNKKKNIPPTRCGDSLKQFDEKCWITNDYDRRISATYANLLLDPWGAFAPVYNEMYEPWILEAPAIGKKSFANDVVPFIHPDARDKPHVGAPALLPYESNSLQDEALALAVGRLKENVLSRKRFLYRKFNFCLLNHHDKVFLLRGVTLNNSKYRTNLKPYPRALEAKNVHASSEASEYYKSEWWEATEFNNRLFHAFLYGTPYVRKNKIMSPNDATHLLNLAGSNQLMQGLGGKKRIVQGLEDSSLNRMVSVPKSEQGVQMKRYDWSATLRSLQRLLRQEKGGNSKAKSFPHNVEAIIYRLKESELPALAYKPFAFGDFHYVPVYPKLERKDNVWSALATHWYQSPFLGVRGNHVAAFRRGGKERLKLPLEIDELGTLEFVVDYRDDLGHTIVYLSDQDKDYVGRKYVELCDKMLRQAVNVEVVEFHPTYDERGLYVDTIGIQRKIRV